MGRAAVRALAPVRSWVLPGDTADVSTVAKIKADLHAWRLGRCLFVGDAGMYSADIGKSPIISRSRRSGSARVSGASATCCA